MTRVRIIVFRKSVELGFLGNGFGGLEEFGQCKRGSFPGRFPFYNIKKYTYSTYEDSPSSYRHKKYTHGNREPDKRNKDKLQGGPFLFCFFVLHGNRT